MHIGIFQFFFEVKDFSFLLIHNCQLWINVLRGDV